MTNQVLIGSGILLKSYTQQGIIVKLLLLERRKGSSEENIIERWKSIIKDLREIL